MRRMINLGWRAIVVLLFAMVSMATNLAQSRTTDNDPAQILLHAEQVYDAAVGYSGNRMPEYSAFASLWKQRDGARSTIDQLIEKGTPAGRLYGLILLRQIDRQAAIRVGRTMRDSTETVGLFKGCIVTGGTLSELVDRVLMGEQLILPPADEN